MEALPLESACLEVAAFARVSNHNVGSLQELLHHPFLRPTAAPAPGLVGVTRSQLRKLLAQLSTVTASGGRADIDALSEELFRQLANGEAVDLAALVARPNPAGVGLASCCYECVCVGCKPELAATAAGGRSSTLQKLVFDVQHPLKNHSHQWCAAQPPASHAGGETAAQRKAPAAKAASMGALGSLHVSPQYFAIPGPHKPESAFTVLDVALLRCSCTPIACMQHEQAHMAAARYQGGQGGVEAGGTTCTSNKTAC